MRRFLLFVALILCHNLIAQDYTPFSADVSKRFVNANDEADDDYFFYSTSNTIIENIVNYEQYYTVQSIEWDWEGAPGESECGFWGGNIGIGLDTTWLGNSIFYDEGLKSLLLLNEEGDSLNFNFNMAIGDSALFYSSDTLNYYITYISIIEDSNLGVIDSCKIFTVQSYNDFGILQSNSLSDFEIKISKELGMLSFIDCYHFPNELIPVQIKGQTNPLLGIYQMTYLDAYPWNEGDVIQYQGDHSQPAWGGGFTFYTTTYETLTISERVETEDSVFIYFTSEVASIQNVGPETIGGIFIPLDSPIIFHVQDLIIEVPHNFAIRDNSNPYLFYGEDDIEECGTDNAIRLRNQFASYCDSCLCYGSADGFGNSVQSRSYKENKGHTGTSYLYYGGIQDNPSKSIGQIYSNINGVECGDLIVLGIDELNAIQFEVFPNPSNGKFSISSEIIPKSIRVFDLSGRQVFQSNDGLSFQNDIDLGNVDTGVYLLQLEFKEGVFTKKLVIH